MAQQLINVGTSANDRTGDTLRASQQKTNANTTELYLTKEQVLVEGNNITIDRTNPLAPVISSSGGQLTGVVPETRTITINGITQDLSANRTFTVSGGDVYEYMNFYISGNVPYNANPDLEPFPTRGNKDVGNLAYPGDFWNRVTSTTGDYRGTAQSIFKASNLVEVIVNSSGITADLQIRVVAFDVTTGGGGSITNPRSIAVKTLTGISQLRTSIFLPSDINLTNVINTNTMISITATVKSGTVAATVTDRCYITLKFKNI